MTTLQTTFELMSSAPQLPPGFEHGTERGSRKCTPTCADCRAAATTAQAERRARRRQRPIPEEAHGRASTYTDLACRCDLCSEAALGISDYKPPTRAEQEEASRAALAGLETRTVRYEYPIRLDPAVEQRLRSAIGAARVVYNSYVEFITGYRSEHGRYPTSMKGLSSLLITEPRRDPERPWLAAVPYTVLSAALRQGETALSNHLNSLAGVRKGPKVQAPTFKPKKSGGTAHFARGQFRIVDGWQNTGPTGGRLDLGRHIGRVHVNWTRPLPSQPSSVAIVLRPSGRWFASFVVEEPLRRTKPQASGRAVGVDLGLEHFAVLAYSDGRVERIENPRFLAEAEWKLARMQRDTARMQGPERGRKPSKRWEQQRTRVARLHARIADRREAFARGLAARLIRENQAIVVEALNIAGLARTKVGKSIYDAAWGVFLRALAEGAANHGRDLIVLPRFFPGTRTCSICGTNGGAKPLDVRIWECRTCGSTLDRDTNAAVNHLQYAFDVAALSEQEQEALGLAAGLADRMNARGWDGRRKAAMTDSAVPCEARSHRNRQERKLLAGRRKSMRTAQRRKHGRNGSSSRPEPRESAEQRNAGGKGAQLRRKGSGLVAERPGISGAE